MAKIVRWVAQGGNGSFMFINKPIKGEMFGEPTFGFDGDNSKCEEISTDAANKMGASYGKCVKITIEEEEYD